MRPVGEFLDTLEENAFSVLYQCRWDRELSDDVTRQLKRCLASADDAEDLRRGLAALHRIGVPASAAISDVIPLVWHAGDIVARTAILTLGSIGLHKAHEVVPALIFLLFTAITTAASARQICAIPPLRPWRPLREAQF
jgi:hypothetical protein